MWISVSCRYQNWSAFSGLAFFRVEQGEVFANGLLIAVMVQEAWKITFNINPSFFNIEIVKIEWRWRCCWLGFTSGFIIDLVWNFVLWFFKFQLYLFDLCSISFCVVFFVKIYHSAAVRFRRNTVRSTILVQLWNLVIPIFKNRLFDKTCGLVLLGSFEKSFFWPKISLKKPKTWPKFGVRTKTFERTVGFATLGLRGLCIFSWCFKCFLNFICPLRFAAASVGLWNFLRPAEFIQFFRLAFFEDSSFSDASVLLSFSSINTKKNIQINKLKNKTVERCILAVP